jgi:hypothetical protein
MSKRDGDCVVEIVDGLDKRFVVRIVEHSRRVGEMLTEVGVWTYGMVVQVKQVTVNVEIHGEGHIVLSP